MEWFMKIQNIGFHLVLLQGRGVFYAVDEAGIIVDTLEINYPTMRESQGLAYDGTNFWYVERKTARCDLFKA